MLVILLLMAGVMYVKQYSADYYWKATYKYKSDEPYGTQHLYEQLQNTFGNKKFKLLDKKPPAVIDEDEINSLIFYIGFDTYYDSLTIEWFKDYLYRGNKICIASDVLPFQLLNEIYELDTVLFYTDTLTSRTVKTSFTNNSEREYNFHHQFVKDTIPYTWNYFAETTINDYWKSYLYEPVSVIEENKVNYLSIKYGEGNLYVYTTPLLLTNYFFVTEEGFGYANEFFASMGRFDKIYWDDFSRFSMPRSYGRGSINKRNPIEFILENTALRWAWYLFMSGIVLFALFKLKRRQKPIEIITIDKNTSVEYVKAVGLLHYKTSGYKELAERLMKIFHQYINSKYGIVQNLEKDERVRQIVLHSGLPKKKIDSIFKSHFGIKFNPEPEVANIIKLHSDLEYFYKNCK